MGRLFLLATLAVSSSWAQVTTGTILGVVKDASGAVVPGAKVRVVNEDTNIGVNVLVNNNGDFVAPNLTPAVYVLQVEAAGFKKVSIAHITLQLSGTVRQDIQLETGRLEQEVTVTAEAPVINSGDVVDFQRRRFTRCTESAARRAHTRQSGLVHPRHDLRQRIESASGGQPVLGRQ